MSNKLIILLAGGIGAGKDTVADHLVEKFGFAKLSFAGALKAAAADLLRFPQEWCFTREGKDKKPPLGNGLTVGEILQRFGTEVGRNINPDLWAQIIATDIEAQGWDKVVVSDCRFENEATYFLGKNVNAHVMHLTRRPQELVGGRDTKHASENQEWANSMWEKQIRNFHRVDNANGITVDQTLATIDLIMGDLLFLQEEE